MLSNPQKSLIKRAQRQAALLTTLADVTSLPLIRSSKDPRLTDAHVDTILSYFEAIYWRKVDSGELQHFSRRHAPFLERGYWTAKNTRGNTSRDRYTAQDLAGQVTVLESEMYAAGHGFKY